MGAGGGAADLASSTRPCAAERADDARSTTPTPSRSSSSSLLFLFVTWLGFVAARWRKADLDLLDEWGLGGRRFGTVVTWFLLGGDLYTAYTFIAVPALVFGAGAMGFFAVPYTILVYPIVFIVLPRLWAVAHARGHVTPADFVRGRFGSRTLALAVALTGIVATMPYIALQLVGMEVVLGALGFPAGGSSAICRSSSPSPSSPPSPIRAACARRR